MKKITFLLCFLISVCLYAQIKGKVTNTKGEGIPYASVYLDNSTVGTTSNDDGFYELNIKKKGKYTIVFQFLGYKTEKKSITVTSFPFKLNVKLVPQEVILDVVTVSSTGNPANRIIKNAIASKDKNTQHLNKFAADFYSRGIFRIKNAPKRIFGQDIGDLGGTLDSTRSGIIYLSETVSKIKSQKKPKKFKERIIASKVSGRNNGISFNQAEQVNFNPYENTIEVNNQQIISPIANSAFIYYKYKLKGTYTDKNNKLINKIKVIPKRKNERVFSGFIYIVEDDWAIAGAELSLSGAQMGVPAIEKTKIKQDYKYLPNKNLWALITQTIDFKMAMLGIEASGKFSASYSNYNFTPTYTKKTFTNEILSFDKDATKKDSVFWTKLRSIPLTLEEKVDYHKKDSIRILRKSKKYLDSIDAKKNKFGLTSPIFGYTYTNSYNKWNLTIDSPLAKLAFNTVQGWNTDLGGSFFKNSDEEGKWYQIKASVNYGFADKKWRPTGSFTYHFNNISRPVVQVSGGVKTSQFNYRNPISKLYNSISTVFFERNYMKLYEKQFARVNYAQEITNGVRLYTSLEYANRKPLVNKSHTPINYTNRQFTSNDPQNPLNFGYSFAKHNIWEANISAQFTFGNKYMSLPNTKWNIGNKKYPKLYVGYRKGFGAKNSNQNYDLFLGRLEQNFAIGSIGNFDYVIRAGVFAKKKSIAFMDKLHPNGNRFELVNTNYVNHFNLLDYYAFSTNDKYSEMHVQHNFNGFLLGKIPLLNKLNFHLVAGGKMLFTASKQPYIEYSVGLNNIGYGKWRFLRVDYVRSFYNGRAQDGFVFGINLIE